MKRRMTILLIALLIALLPVMPVSAGKKLTPGLTPGKFEVFEQEVPINIVFIGYDDADVDAGEILGGLPATSTPLVRYPQFYGLPGRDLGLKFNFTYNTIFTNDAFERQFFKYLGSIGLPGDLTDYQQGYNDMETNVLDVTGPVLYIDGPSVEKYLFSRATSLGINTKRGYTIFFINWYDKAGFKFHVYTKTDVVDPDTDYNFGEQRSSRKFIAWGGSYSRSWFYDLSAGPEAWTDNWAVDYPDLDGDGVEDYRMPPIWEYVAGGNRDPGQISNDLMLVSRFVAINLLFTTSPLYDPLVTAPELFGQKISHTEMFEDDPTSYGPDWIDTSFIYDRLTRFEPYYNWETHLEDNNPIDTAAQRALQIFSTLLSEDDCWNTYGDPFAELFCFFDMHYADYVPAYDEEDYVATIFAFNTTAATLGPQFGLLGFADDNWTDGTQSYIFAFDANEYRDLGYGFSTTAVHETGHHIGMSHPHDGYDPEFGIDYGPSGPFYFSWSGDESNTIMHYMDISDVFGQFDQDNMYRYEFAGYMNWANELLGMILHDPRNKSVRPLISQAKLRGAIAAKSFDKWEYLKAADNAHAAYLLLVQAAETLGIELPETMQALRIAPSMQAPHEGDPIRFPDN